MEKLKTITKWLLAKPDEVDPNLKFGDLILLSRPFIQKGWMWDHIPLFFWIIIMILYTMIFVISILSEFFVIALLMVVSLFGYSLYHCIKYIALPILQTIGISLIHPDGTAIEKIKNVWVRHNRFFHEDNQNSDYDRPFTSDDVNKTTNIPQSNTVEKQSMFESLTSDQMIEKFKENEKINHHTFQDNLQDKIKGIENKD